MSRIPLNVDSYEGHEGGNSEEIARFVVMYGKASTRKHKIWEGDGLLICHVDSCFLKSEDESDTICRSSAMKNLEQLEDGRIINIGSWSVQIQERVASVKKSISTSSGAIQKENFGKRAIAQTIEPKSVAPPPKRRSFVPPLLSSDGGATSSLVPRHATSSQEPPPLVLNEQEVLTGGAPPILVDPRFARHLRDHQKRGVRFIFERLASKSGGGAILADDMGLGKSIQTMAATWALLKGSKNGRNVADACLIVVPSSLVNNWKAEFAKWWRLMRFPAVLAQKAKEIVAFQSTMKLMPYLVISYDMALRYVEKLRAIRFDVLVCDEGHKLKNMDSKLRRALASLQIPRRLLLTGTPMQNDFDEFHSLLDFVRPGQFGNPSEFRTACSASPDELNAQIDECMLRRTAADVNTSHLPEKHEYILFCAASPTQKQIHTEICNFMTGDALSLIFFARQLANHPKLLVDNLREKHAKGKTQHTALLVSCDSLNVTPKMHESGKLAALADMLKCFRGLGECAVLVSNYIETLSMIESLCKFLGFRVFRLDGTTPVDERQKAVNTFNDASDATNVFLLSTKAGGAGLNLIGASRLVLFDSDWNPAMDRQAMARIWRDGQLRPCHIYRLVTTGTIEEKMLQRQIKKTGLGCVIDAMDVGDAVSTFTDEELKDIFTFADETECNTHDLCGCECDGNGLLPDEMEDDEEASDAEAEAERDAAEDSDDDEEVDDEELEADTTIQEKENEEEDGDEIVEDSADELDERGNVGKAEKKKKEEPATASLAELSRWRHFSPRHADTWRYFLSNAGLSQVDNTDVELTFAFYQSTRF